ncbi:hypothetical protein CC1G_15004 [Coprinopsis cinerea okayama7|uniref:F-box domain-containing protein n=1 Tax=Coprinopsis cinerea (strain Okayama-7 / 130 / ATCC MYA-4618 / FGSC 9003) TaxID=240176 RepID=D6RP56_COPC7|nr:hypothetical protein CC1G_15004 [Coprinopsis cinerea okayama7\|eukprot:XP_002910673.1 hypothetical protein CC1G_15004 [Coprinopsis cinerea okayama7\
MQRSLPTLQTELLLQILLHLARDDVLKPTRTCRALNAVVFSVSFQQNGLALEKNATFPADDSEPAPPPHEVLSMARQSFSFGHQLRNMSLRMTQSGVRELLQAVDDLRTIFHLSSRLDDVRLAFKIEAPVCVTLSTARDLRLTSEKWKSEFCSLFTSIVSKGCWMLEIGTGQQMTDIDLRVFHSGRVTSKNQTSAPSSKLSAWFKGLSIKKKAPKSHTTSSIPRLPPKSLAPVPPIHSYSMTLRLTSDVLLQILFLDWMISLLCESASTLTELAWLLPGALPRRAIGRGWPRQRISASSQYQDCFPPPLSFSDKPRMEWFARKVVEALFPHGVVLQIFQPERPLWRSEEAQRELIVEVVTRRIPM